MRIIMIIPYIENSWNTVNVTITTKMRKPVQIKSVDHKDNSSLQKFKDSHFCSIKMDIIMQQNKRHLFNKLEGVLTYKLIYLSMYNVSPL